MKNTLLLQYSSLHYISTTFLLFFIITTSLLGSQSGAHAFVVPLDKSVLPAIGEQALMVRAGVFAPQDAPMKTSPGDGRAFVSFDVEWSGPQKSQLYALLFHSDDKRYIGFTDNKKQFRWCDTNGKLHLEHSINEKHIFDNIYLENVTKPEFSDKISITKSGMYYAALIKCGNTSSNINLSGEMIFMNPYGHLRGELYGTLPFFAILSGCYLITSIFWGILSVRHWKDILNVQIWLSLLLLVSMLECSALYFHYLTLNINGTSMNGFLAFGILLGLIRRTMARLLLLFVAMGLGVVKSSLGTSTRMMTLMATVYFVFSCIWKISTELFVADYTSIGTVVIASLPVSVLDYIFFLWIYSSLKNTMSQLHHRHQTAKLNMYKKLKYILVLYIAASCVWVAYEIYFKYKNSMDRRWDSLWSLDAMWEVIYAICFIMVLVIWRPTSNNARYAMSDQLPTEWDEDEVNSPITDDTSSTMSTSDMEAVEVQASEAPITPSETPQPKKKKKNRKHGDRMAAFSLLDEDSDEENYRNEKQD